MRSQHYFFGLEGRKVFQDAREGAIIFLDEAMQLRRGLVIRGLFHRLCWKLFASRLFNFLNAIFFFLEVGFVKGRLKVIWWWSEKVKGVIVRFSISWLSPERVMTVSSVFPWL